MWQERGEGEDREKVGEEGGVAGGRKVLGERRGGRRGERIGRRWERREVWQEGGEGRKNMDTYIMPENACAR